MGKEAEFEIVPAEKTKTLLIVGGGPAGMEAARVAALRGHHVTLCEKEDQLGGTAFFASIIYPENGRLVEYLKTQVQKLPIDLRLGQEVTPDFVKQLNPDQVLLALGAKRQAPPIPGVDQRNVFTGDDLREMLTGASPSKSKKLSLGQRALVAGGSFLGINRDVDKIRKMSKLWMPLGKRAVIVGGGLVGVELAGFLAERGLRVTVLEEKDYLAPEMSLPRRWRVLHDLRNQGVTMRTGVRIEKILDKGVTFVDKKGNKDTATAHSVILATGAMPNQNLFDRLNNLGYEAALIGDCREIGYIEGAMTDGARMGRQI